MPDASEFAAVLVTHNDTFTGAVCDLAEIGTFLRDLPTLLIVDAVSSLGSIPVESDSWGLDIVVAASQKGLMCPPGLAILSVSDKAWRRINDIHDRGEYWSLRRARQAWNTNEAAFTPAVNTVFALHEALTMIHAAGIHATYDRQASLSKALVAGATELNLRLFPSPETASPSVAVFEVPDGIDANEVVSQLYTCFGTVAASARNSPLSGKVVRLGTMGHCQPDDIRLDIHQIATIFRKMGVATDEVAALNATESLLK
jgi:aspartate aminotransferase-like enzyme